MSAETIRERVLAMKIEELDMSVRSFNCLKRAGYNTIEDLVNKTEYEVGCCRNLGKKSLEEVMQKLASLGLFLKPSCKNCGIEITEHEKNYGEHLCNTCRGKIFRTQKAKDLTIEVFPPEKSSYTGGYNGLHIFINVKNNTSFPLKLELTECAIFKDGRQHCCESNLVGYSFSEEHVLPGITKTFAKIWKTDSWIDQELIPSNYLTISFKDKNNGRIYFFKYSKTIDGWSFDDYFEVIDK